MFKRKEGEVSNTFKCDHRNNVDQKNKIRKDPRKNLIIITPEELKFTFLNTSLQKQQKVVKITNYSSKPCPLLISPPKTCYFKITSKTLKEWLNPGASFSLKICFMPDEIRNYYDSVKIQEFEKQSSVLNISAIPTCNINYPNNVNLGNVPLGSTVRYQIPIYSHPEKRISFAVFLLSEMPCCLNVYPRRGSLKPRQNPIIVNIEYQTLRYITATFRIQLFIPEICKSPFLMNFVAYTYPGLQREKLEQLIESVKNHQEKPKKNKSLGREELTKLDTKISSVTSKNCKQKREKKKIEENDEQRLFKEMGKIPPHSLHGVNFIMNTRFKKSHDKFELRGPLNMYILDAMKEKMERQNEFLMKTEKLWKLNENARNNRTPKLGENFTTSYKEKLVLILEERNRHSCEYKNKMITTSTEELLQRDKVVKIRQRVLRSCTQNFEKSTPHQLSCDWFLRYSIIAPFIQAARLVILKNRWRRVLSILKKLTPEIIERIEKLVLKEREKLKYEWQKGTKRIN